MQIVTDILVNANTKQYASQCSLVAYEDLALQAGVKRALLSREDAAGGNAVWQLSGHPTHHFAAAIGFALNGLRHDRGAGACCCKPLL
jgi:hypothetical protein